MVLAYIKKIFSTIKKPKDELLISKPDGLEVPPTLRPIVRQYYHEREDCPTRVTGKCDFYFLDCRCWYDVGTGPRAEDNYIHQWRNPPDFQRELHCITINVGAVFGPALFYPEQADRLLHDYLLPAMQLPYITELDLYEVTNYSTVCLIMIFAGLLEHGYTATEVLSKLWINSSDRDLINEVHNILTYRLVA